MIPTTQPYPTFNGLNGLPLTGGYVYIGAENLNPETNPVAVYWDAAGTIPAAQPIRTAGGFPVRNGTPASLFVNGNFSITVRDSKKSLVYTERSSPLYPFMAVRDNLSNTTDLAFGDAMIGVKQPFTGAVAMTQHVKNLDSVYVEDFGAVGDGATLNSAAVQKAIDYMFSIGGGAVKFRRGTYLMDPVNYYTDADALFGICSIIMRDGVFLVGEGYGTILKVQNGTAGPGTYYRMITSRDGVRLSNAGVLNLVVDGNKANQTASVQCDNIQLEALNNIAVVNVFSINANGNAIMVRGTTTTRASNVLIDGCTVFSANTIGIQCSQFYGLRIVNNYVAGTTDNCIDIYGEDGTTTCNGSNFVVSGNTVNSGLVGIFLETVRNGVASNNTVENCILGITVNRINGQPRSIQIHNNNLYSNQYGCRVTGDTGGVSIKHNTFDGFAVSGVQIGDVGGNGSYVDVSSNTFIPSSATVPIILTAGNVVSFCTGRDNTVIFNGMVQSYLCVKAATTNVDVSIGGFRVLPGQVGPDTYGELAQFTRLTLQAGTADNTAGPVVITIPDSSAGQLHITSHQGGTGKSYWMVPFVKSGGVLAIGTPSAATKAVLTADPITGVSVSANNVSVALGAANTFLQWGIQSTAVS